jgi:hypothetical protein
MTQILTANRLQKGEVVYWGGPKGWVVNLSDAEPLDDAVAEDVLKQAQIYVARQDVVATYLFDARVENGAIKPVKMREVIRAAGPTVRRDLGKQAG